MIVIQYIYKTFQKYNLIIMKVMIAQRNRQSSGALKTNHRKYIKKPSPDTSVAYIQPASKSNQQILQHIIQQVPSANTNNINPNNRYSELSNNNKSSNIKLTSKQQSLLQYQLFGLSKSKQFIGDRRKKGKSSFHKKIIDLNNSEIFFMESKVPTTKQVSKVSSPSDVQLSIQQFDNQVQELHYKMVQFQRKCKKAVLH